MSERDFLDSEHQMMFVVMKSLLKNGVEEFDQTTIINRATNEGVLGNIGGPEYVQSIDNMPLSQSNFDLCLKNVLDSSTKFKLYCSLKNNMKELLDNASTDVSGEDLIGLVENAVLDLSMSSKSIVEPTNLADGIEEYIEDRINNPVATLGVPTGYPILDKQLDGLVPTTLTVISARKKMGKSAFLSNVAANVAYVSPRMPILYIDTEMSFAQWRSRMLAMVANVRERDIIHGNLTDEDKDELRKAANVIKSGKLFHKHLPGFSIDKIVALYKKYKTKENIGLAIFDYIKEPAEGSSLDRKRKEYQLLGDLTTRMKDLSSELNIPFLTAVQVNRDGDVAGSDRISWFADVIMEWSERKKEDLEVTGFPGGQYKLVIRDSRRGGRTAEQGICYKFFKQKLRIEEVLPEFQQISYDDVVNYGSDDDEEAFLQAN
jgi:replicative DNA helicase